MRPHSSRAGRGRCLFIASTATRVSTTDFLRLVDGHIAPFPDCAGSASGKRRRNCARHGSPSSKTMTDPINPPECKPTRAGQCGYLTWEHVKKAAAESPHLRPCPVHTPPSAAGWYWIYRTGCTTCPVHTAGLTIEETRAMLYRKTKSEIYRSSISKRRQEW